MSASEVCRRYPFQYLKSVFCVVSQSNRLLITGFSAGEILNFWDAFYPYQMNYLN
jgi:hypothetical protein